MGTYQIKSLIGEIAEGIKRLLAAGQIREERRALLYGLDRYAFAMRTILSNLGFGGVEGYLTDDEGLALQYRQEIRNFSCRFLNGERDLIEVWTLKQRLCPFDEKALILVASKEYGRVRAELEKLGYKENRHFFCMYDFRDKEQEQLLAGKKRMTLPEIKETEKGILSFIDQFCREKGLRYWVCGGTLLGTIRHQGFIPWDDDIDIFLPWQDYRKFLRLFQESSRFDTLGFGASPVNDFPDLLAKVVDKRTIVVEDIGTVKKITPLWVDVFPLVGLPEDAGRRELFFRGYQEINRRIWQDFYKENGSLAVFSKWASCQREYLSRYDFDESAYAGVLGTIYGPRDATSRQVYEKTVRMAFEDILVNVPAGYEEYLRNLYGSDYKKLPPQEKRKTHHNMQAYWNA